MNDEPVAAPPTAKRCDDCGAPLRFAKHAYSKAIMAMDWHPNGAGNIVVLTGGRSCVVLTKAQLNGREAAPAGTRYMPHQATCPNQSKQTALPFLPDNVVQLEQRRKDLR